MFLDGPRPGGLVAATNGGAGCGAQAATPTSNIGERNRRFIGFSHAIRNRLDLARVPLFLMLPTRGSAHFACFLRSDFCSKTITPCVWAAGALDILTALVERPGELVGLSRSPITQRRSGLGSIGSQ